MPPALALALLLASAPGAAPVPSDSPDAPVPSDSSVAPVPSDSPAAPGPADSPAPAPFTALALRADGPGLAGLGDALALRLPELPIVAESPADGAPFVFVAVRTDAAVLVRHQVGVITSDGRAYFREVDTGADPPARVLASVIANLLRSIAQGTVRPDRTDVAIPPPDADPLAVPPVPEDRPSEPVPEDRPPEPAAKAAPTQPATQPPPRWQFAPVLVAGAGLGLGPPQFGRALTGGGGSLGLDARAPNGALLGLELRAIGQRADDYGLARLRVAVLAGYALRRGRLELPVALGLSVEPWWVSPATAVTDTRGARPLLGALLRVAPGLHFTFAGARAGLRGLRVGPRLELAGSFLVDDGAKVGGVSRQVDGGARELFRVGGLELHLGLELALWFGR